jgi:hypothetical protein
VATQVRRNIYGSYDIHIVINSRTFMCTLWFHPHTFFLSSPNDSYYKPFLKYIREIRPSCEKHGYTNRLSSSQCCETEVPTLARVHLSNLGDCPTTTSSQSINTVFSIEGPYFVMRIAGDVH